VTVTSEKTLNKQRSKNNLAPPNKNKFSSSAVSNLNNAQTLNEDFETEGPNKENKQAGNSYSLALNKIDE